MPNCLKWFPSLHTPDYKDRCSGSSPSKHLSNEEAHCVDYLAGCASIGYAKSHRDVLAIAQQIASAWNLNVEATKGWLDSFHSKHPEIMHHQVETLPYARAVANNKEIINKYFDLLEDTRNANGLTKYPLGELFNCDMIGMPLVHNPQKSCHMWARSIPMPLLLVANLIILACASATEYAISQMVIFDRKYLQSEMMVGEVPRTFYGLSENG